MTGNLPLEMFGVWTLTYLVHSTLLLASVWLICRGLIRRSHVLRERLWKIAATGGFLTSLLAVCCGWGLSVAIATTNQPRSNVVIAEPITDSELLTAEDAELLREADALAALVDEGTLPGSSEALVDAFNSIEPPAQEVAPFRLDALKAPQANDVASVESVFAGELMLSVEPVNGGQIEERATAEPIAAVSDGRAGASALQSLLPDAASVIGWIAAFWITIGLLRVLQREWVLHRILRRCQLLTSAGNVAFRSAKERSSETQNASLALQLLAELATRSHARMPRLMLSSDITEPMACGLWRPTIILPTDCEQRLHRDELRALLAHEFAHLRRGDVIWLWIGRVLCSSFSFQPLNFMSRRAWQAEAEVRCDDWAVAHDVSAVSLASCLAEVAEWKLDRRAASALAVTGSRSSLAHRIERLLADRTADVWSTRWRSRLSLLAAFCFGLLFASVAPRLDDASWANARAEEDLAARRQLWNEISAELSAVRDELDRMPVHDDEALTERREAIERLKLRVQGWKTK